MNKNKKIIKNTKNKRVIFSLLIIIFLSALFILPLSAFAQISGNASGSVNVTPNCIGPGCATSSSSGGAGSGFNYKPMENIPGTDNTPGDFKAYVLAIYKFGIWGIGIAALFMIMLGGFMYITSAGNQASMGKAKGYITDAIIGLIMAMTAWLLLNEINPDLLKIKALTGGTSGGAAQSGSPAQSAAQQAASGQTPVPTNANPSNAPADIQQKAKDYAAKNGVPESVALNMLNTESGGVNGLTSSAGASGLLQLMPGTASSLGVTDPMNADQNLNAGYKYADQLYNKYGDWGQAMAAYNWGPGNMDSYLKTGVGAKGQPMPAETKNYVNKTMGSCSFC